MIKSIFSLQKKTKTKINSTLKRFSLAKIIFLELLKILKNFESLN